MQHLQHPGRVLFAAGLTGLGILGLVYGDFALVWQPVPKWVPARELLAYISGTLLLAGGAGLLWDRTAVLASRTLLVYIFLWLLLLKVPDVLTAPTVEASWLGCGEIGVILAGAWVLFAALSGPMAGAGLNLITGANGLRGARVLFAIALPAIGLSHFVYVEQTAGFVPAWLPWHVGWAYLTGAGNIAAGLAVFFSILPRLAATLEAAMMSAFTLLIWLPGVMLAPTDRLQWTALAVSWTIASGAWVVADSYSGMPWIAIGSSAKAAPSN
jgi:uncharacterized membrane protein